MDSHTTTIISNPILQRPLDPVTGQIPCCLRHPDRPQEQFCNDCQLPMCWKCVVCCHGYHNTSSIEYPEHGEDGDDTSREREGRGGGQGLNDSAGEFLTAGKFIPTSRLGPGVHLVQCVTHKDRCLEMYCVDCRLYLCWKCVVCCHRLHNTVEIGSDLDNLIPAHDAY